MPSAGSASGSVVGLARDAQAGLSVTLIAMGATALQRRHTGGMRVDYSAVSTMVDVVHAAERRARGLLEGVSIADVVVIPSRSGALLQWATLDRVRQEVFAAEARAMASTDSGRRHAGCVVLTGTDALEEVAFGLDLWLPASRRPGGATEASQGRPDQTPSVGTGVVVTGAMRPASALGWDGPANLASAAATVASLFRSQFPGGGGAGSMPLVCRAPTGGAAATGVVVAMDGRVHAARFVRKSHTRAMGSFVSSVEAGGAGAGPLAEVRSGCVHWLVGDGCAAAAAAAAGAGRSSGSAAGGPTLHRRVCPVLPPHEPMGEIGLAALEAVVVHSLAAGASAGWPLDGAPASTAAAPRCLVLHGMGTGSLPPGWQEGARQLVRRGWRVCVTSRCGAGAAADDHLYEGSVKRQEAGGLEVTRFWHLPPIQAAVAMVFSRAQEVERGATVRASRL